MSKRRSKTNIAGQDKPFGSTTQEEDPKEDCNTKSLDVTQTIVLDDPESFAQEIAKEKITMDNNDIASKNSEEVIYDEAGTDKLLDSVSLLLKQYRDARANQGDSQKKVDELSTRMDSVTDLLNAQNDSSVKVDEVARQLEDIGKRLDDANEILNSKLEESKRLQDENQKHLADSQKDQNEALIVELNRQLNQIGENLQAATDLLDSKIGDANEKVEQVNQMIEKGQKKGHDQLFAAIAQQLESLTNRVDESARTLNMRIENSGVTVTKLIEKANEHNETTEKVDQLSNELSNVSGVISSLSGDVTTMNARLEETAQNLSTRVVESALQTNELIEASQKRIDETVTSALTETLSNELNGQLEQIKSQFAESNVEIAAKIDAGFTTASIAGQLELLSARVEQSTHQLNTKIVESTVQMNQVLESGLTSKNSGDQTAKQLEQLGSQLALLVESGIQSGGEDGNGAALAAHMDSRMDDVMKYIDARMDDSAKQLNQLIDRSQNESNDDATSQIIEQIQKLNDRLDEVGSQVSQNGSGDNDETIVAVIEHSEKIDKRLDEVMQQVNERMEESAMQMTQFVASGGGGEGGGDGEQVAAALAAQIQQISNRIDESADSATTANARIDESNHQTSQMLEKLDSLAIQIEQGSSAAPASDDSANERIDLLTAQLEENQETLNTLVMAVGPLVESIDQIRRSQMTPTATPAFESGQPEDAESLLEDVFVEEQLEEAGLVVPAKPAYASLTLDDLKREAAAEVLAAAEAAANAPVEVPVVEVVDEDAGLSDWEKQKKALLSNYGSEGDDISAAPAKQKPTVQPIVDHVIAVDESVGTVEEIIENVVTNEKDDAEAAALEDKLRQAEVQISIERARLLREQQKMDREQAEIQRVQKKKDKQDEGGRWSRFLGKQSDDE